MTTPDPKATTPDKFAAAREELTALAAQVEHERNPVTRPLRDDEQLANCPPTPPSEAALECARKLHPLNCHPDNDCWHDCCQCNDEHVQETAAVIDAHFAPVAPTPQAEGTGTPRTDAVFYTPTKSVPSFKECYDFARTLERENNALKARIAELESRQ